MRQRFRHSVSTVASIFFIGILPLVAGSCAAKPDPSPKTKTSVRQDQPATLTFGAPIPHPSAPVVLTIKNAKNPNEGNDLELSLDQLDAMGTISYKVKDSDATNKVSRFSGPLFRDVLKYAGVSGQTVTTLALNDYVIDIPMKVLERYPVLIATHQDGSPMTVSNYGPTRVIFPNVDYHIDNSYDTLWVWQLKSLSVK